MANYEVYSDRPMSEAVNYAERVLYGYHGEYLFFRGGLSDCYLIFNGIIDGGDHQAITFTDCYVYRFHVLTDGTYSLDPSWGQSGTVTNSGYRVIYGSEQYMCKLLDNGGEWIEAATLIGLSVLTMFIIFDRIFHSVSRR